MRRTHSFRPRLDELEDRTTPANGGLLDPTFGGTGVVNLAMPRTNTPSVVIQPQDGKLVSAGSSYSSAGGPGVVRVIRLNPNGSPDTSFNGTGHVDLPVGYASFANTLALQPDGKIVIGGSTYRRRNDYSPPFSSGYNSAFLVTRLNSNGTLDKTFGNRGFFTWDRTTTYDDVQKLAVLGDGSIVALGGGQPASSGALLFKLNPGGSLVPSFGNGGVAQVQVNSGVGTSGMVVAPGGNLIVSGHSFTDTTFNISAGLILAVNPATGQPDPAFGNGQGWVTGYSPDGTSVRYHAVTVQGSNIVVGGAFLRDEVDPNGNHVAAGYNLVARYTLSGALDTQFGTDGHFTMRGPGVSAIATELDGSIVFNCSTNGYDTRIGHLSADGALDASFGNDAVGVGLGPGIMQITAGSAPGSLSIDASGRIVVSGTSAPGYSSPFFARLTPPEAMIASFTATPNPVAAGGSATLTAWGITANGAATITQVRFYYRDGSGTEVILGYGTETSPGVWALTFTVGLAPGAHTICAQATDSDGVAGGPASLTLEVI